MHLPSWEETSLEVLTYDISKLTDNSEQGVLDALASIGIERTQGFVQAGASYISSIDIIKRDLIYGYCIVNVWHALNV